MRPMAARRYRSSRAYCGVVHGQTGTTLKWYWTTAGANTGRVLCGRGFVCDVDGDGELCAADLRRCAGK